MFYKPKHCKPLFVGNLRNTHHIISIGSGANKEIKAVGTSGLFYASTLKIFGNSSLEGQLCLKSMLNKLYIKPNGRPTLQEFHHQIKKVIIISLV